MNSSVEKKEIKTSIASNEEYQQKSREELYDEIESLKSKLSNNSGISTPTVPKSIPSPSEQSTYPLSFCDFGQSNDDIIDLYESYNTLSMKHSSHEEHKPLNPMSIHKMDHYMAFFICYMFLNLKVSSNSIAEMFKENWRSKHPDGASKWLLLLDTKHEDSELKDSVQRIINDRSNLFQTNIFPFLHTQDSGNKNVEALIETIQEVLPTKVIAENYLDFFFHFMWIARPFVDEDSFKKDVSRIITFDDVTKKPKVTFSQRSDFAIVATFLIMMRYASIAIAVIDTKDLPSFLVPLKENPVPVKAICVAQMCLSMYKILRKSTIHMVQALLYLRVYFKDCPEDGDGMTLGQSQLLFGFIVQASVAMGLHRDPVHYSQISNDIKEANLRRRLWFCISNIDTETSILSGSLRVLPNPALIDVKLPTLTSMDAIEKAIIDDLEKSEPLNEIYQDFSFDVNNMRSKPTLSRLVGLIEQARQYIDTHYSMKDMISCKELHCGSRIFRGSMYTNLKILQKNLTQMSLELTFYYSLCVNYEANAHLNSTLYKIFFRKCLETLSSSLDLTAAYLSGGFSDYFNYVYANFAILPLLTTTSYRASSVVLAGLLRSYHAQDLLKSHLYSYKYKTTPSSFERLVVPLCKRYEDFMYIYKKKLGIKYYLSLKMISAGKYSYIALKKNKFKIMNKIIKFLEANEKSQVSDVFLSGHKRDEIKKVFQANKSLITVYTEWMQLNNTSKWASYNQRSYQGRNEDGDDSETIININNVNVFLEFTEEEIDEFAGILTNSFRYCPIPSHVDTNAPGVVLSNSSTPTDDFDSYDKFFDDWDFNSQISNIFKNNQASPMGDASIVNDSFLGEIFDQIMDTSATVDDVFKF